MGRRLPDRRMDRRGRADSRRVVAEDDRREVRATINRHVEGRKHAVRRRNDFRGRRSVNRGRRHAFSSRWRPTCRAPNRPAVRQLRTFAAAAQACGLNSGCCGGFQPASAPARRSSRAASQQARTHSSQRTLARISSASPASAASGIRAADRLAEAPVARRPFGPVRAPCTAFPRTSVPARRPRASGRSSVRYRL